MRQLILAACVAAILAMSVAKVEAFCFWEYCTDPGCSWWFC